MLSPNQLTNGLQVVYSGDFEEDPSSDSLLTFAEKHNVNMERLDVALGEVQQITNSITTLRNRGLLSGFIFGGGF